MNKVNAGTSSITLYNTLRPSYKRPIRLDCNAYIHPELLSILRSNPSFDVSKTPQKSYVHLDQLTGCQSTQQHQQSYITSSHLLSFLLWYTQGQQSNKQTNKQTRIDFTLHTVPDQKRTKIITKMGPSFPFFFSTFQPAPYNPPLCLSPLSASSSSFRKSFKLSPCARSLLPHHPCALP